MKKTHFWIIIVVWTSVIIISAVTFIVSTKNSSEKIALYNGRALFEQILASRKWNAIHGGEYVFVNDSIKPNPYLVDARREIYVAKDSILTKVNPAFMTRLISEIMDRNHKVRFHITSLKPLSPTNMPTEWEAGALKSFENGEEEYFEKESNRYKYMAPLITENSCLKCHAVQGYKTGEIRGGISISFPSNEYDELMLNSIFFIFTGHLLTYLLGLFGVYKFYIITKKAFDTIESKNRELDYINKAKDKFFSVIAHDLKSPFNLILGYSDLIKSEYNKMDDNDRKEVIQHIDESAKRAYNLLENLLTWSKLQSNRLVLNFEVINIKETIESSIEPYIENATLKRVAVDLSKLTDVKLTIDRFSLRTIISNFFTNAIKFTNPGGLISIESYALGDECVICIKDNGIGMSADTLKSLEIGENIKSSDGTNNERGSGLGISLCKEFAKRNNGRITIDSIYGKGTTVKIYFNL